LSVTHIDPDDDEDELEALDEAGGDDGLAGALSPPPRPSGSDASARASVAAPQTRSTVEMTYAKTERTRTRFIATSRTST
jgi:hypothetical protein